MSDSKGYLIVEGYGELGAAHNLVSRLSAERELYIPWATPLRWPNLHQWAAPKKGGIARAAEFARCKTDIAALLIIRDEDDGCPARIAPEVGSKLRHLGLPFPTAFVLLRPEYEVLFLPCLYNMSPLGYAPELRWDGESWESKRDIKGWLSKQLPPGRAYKPTTSQLSMTRLVDLQVLREAGVPCFGSLERSLDFIARHLGATGAVYPPPPNR